MKQQLMRLWLSVLYCVLALPAMAAAQQDDEPGVTAADLLAPEMFPDRNYGMDVESSTDGAVAKVVTTGAEFSINKQAGTIECAQRISKQRKVATVKTPPGLLRDLKLTHQSAGAAIFTGAGGATIRINCDSLMMIRPGKDASVKAELAFTPDFHNAFKGNVNFFDPHGGVSFFEHGRMPDAKISLAQDPVSVAYNMKADDVLWVAVSPPKPFSWEASVTDKIVMHGSSNERYMYPSDLSLARWARRFNQLYLHTELMWEHWQLSLVPRNQAEYRRVMNTAHEFGMKVFVYASPKMFLKGTVAEHRAAHDPAAPTAATTTGWHTGSNVKLYLEQATRIVKEFGTDGLYFDEMYTGPRSLAAQYFLARSSRLLVGDGGPLVYHSTTDALGDGHTGPVCPPLNAWFSMILKGENEWNRLDPGYTRYVLSQYNTSNTIGSQLVDERFAPTEQRLDFWLRSANLRFMIPELFFDTGQIEVFRQHYWPRLDAEKLKREIENDLLRPTGVFEQFRASLKKQ